MASQAALPPFSELGLTPQLLAALDEIGYETPSPIQAQTIPLLLKGEDMLGQAQTGTGKTAAFALPLLANIDVRRKETQVLVLAPTRELAIQVAEAFQKYAAKMQGFHVLPVYGGADYGGQIRGLKRGAHVVVGTPGRVMDHMRKGTLKLGGLTTLVLDEADEMLRMGFIDDVEWVLEQLPEKRQIALFSATMPTVIRRIAKTYLKEPHEITVKSKTTTAENIRQRYWMVSGHHKLDALTRILEAETFDASIIFVRTKMATVELADKLAARGYSAAALNGDIQQKQRELTVNRLKNGQLDIVVATDVAARGLDVRRISHVINYDIPLDTESYVHRIGRTGRAGAKGDAILFVAPREKRLLAAIERATKKPIELMELPSTEVINDKRIANFKQRISDTIGVENSEEFEFYSQLIEQYQQEHNVPAVEIAAALAKLLQGDTPLLLKNQPVRSSNRREKFEREPRQSRDRGRDRKRPERGERSERSERSEHSKRPERKERPKQEKSSRNEPEVGMETFRIEVGHEHGVEPGNIVGAIANEAGLESRYIGRIDIQDNHSFVDLPDGMPKDLFKDLKKVWVSGKQLKISRINGPAKKAGSEDAPQSSKAKINKKKKHPKS
ncbi:MAG TPA: DEAD/DEAH box helicase [Ectothiorhodospiraceae bacterium]|nr:DEAD/DEAH box helicase [Ectothiorhodospiraceae bacterium]